MNFSFQSLVTVRSWPLSNNLSWKKEIKNNKFKYSKTNCRRWNQGWIKWRLRLKGLIWKLKSIIKKGRSNIMKLLKTTLKNLKSFTNKRWKDYKKKKMSLKKSLAANTSKLLSLSKNISSLRMGWRTPLISWKNVQL